MADRGAREALRNMAVRPRPEDGVFFFFNDTATTEIYTLSLHDALPICAKRGADGEFACPPGRTREQEIDRKSTRLNSSHDQISYAVFCLKKKNADHQGDHRAHQESWSREPRIQ